MPQINAPAGRLWSCHHLMAPMRVPNWHCHAPCTALGLPSCLVLFCLIYKTTLDVGVKCLAHLGRFCDHEALLAGLKYEPGAVTSKRKRHARGVRYFD